MSIILDALRRGRGRQTPQPNSSAAQTDAVLHTLGYGRFNPTSPFNRLKRLVAYIALAVVCAIVLWGAVIWITQAYWRTPAASQRAALGQDEPGSLAGPMGVPPDATALSPTTVPPIASPPPAGEPSVQFTPAPQTTTKAAPAVVPSGASASAGTASSDNTAGKPSARTTESPAPNRRIDPAPVAADTRVAPNAPNAPNAPSAPNAPNAPNLVVRPSQRVSVPDSAPIAPIGAPSRTALSTAAAAAVTTGDDHFGRGMMYQRLGDFENALVSYRQVLQRDDLNVEAHNNLGVLYRDKGLFDDAIRHFQRAIAINPGYAPARNNLGVVYLTQRKLDAAATQFHASLAIDPKNVESMVNLSTVEKELGRRDEARPWLMRALQADPRNAEAHYNLGLLEDEAGDRTEALVHYRAFLQYGAANHPTLVGEVRARIHKLEGG